MPIRSFNFFFFFSIDRKENSQITDHACNKKIKRFLTQSLWSSVLSFVHPCLGIFSAGVFLPVFVSSSF